jgi:hypothetical protein
MSTAMSHVPEVVHQLRKELHALSAAMSRLVDFITGQHDQNEAQLKLLKEIAGELVAMRLYREKKQKAHEGTNKPSKPAKRKGH